MILVTLKKRELKYKKIEKYIIQHPEYKVAILSQTWQRKNSNFSKKY